MISNQMPFYPKFIPNYPKSKFGINDIFPNRVCYPKFIPR